MSQTFSGKRTAGGAVFAVGVLGLVLSWGACAVLVIRLHGAAEAYLPWLGMGGVVWFYGWYIAARMPRRGELEVEAGWLQKTWNRSGISVRPDEVTFGPWVLPGLDTAIGVVAYAREAGTRRVWRIGGRGHDAHGYALRAAATRTVDFEVDATDFDRLIAALGVPRTGGAREFLVPLTPNSQTRGGLVRMMGPWLLTLVAVSVLGVVLALTGLGERLEAMPGGPMILAVGPAAIIVGGLVWQIVASTRVRTAPMVLAFGAEDVTLKNTRDEVLATARYADLRAVPRFHVVRARAMSSELPFMELTFSEGLLAGRVLTIGAWTEDADWTRRAKRARRGPDLLAGAPQWQRMTALLQQREVIRWHEDAPA